MKKKKSILGSSKPYRNSKWLGPNDKIIPMGPILGAEPKIPKPLDKKFMGCSKNTSTKKNSLNENTIDDMSDVMYLMWNELKQFNPRKLKMKDIIKAAKSIAAILDEPQIGISKTEELISAFLKRPDGFALKLKKRDLVQESLLYNEFANADNAVDKKCPVCGIDFKNIHAKDQKYCCATCEAKGNSVSKLEESWNTQQIKKAGFIPYFRDNTGTLRMLFVKSSDPKFGGDKFMIAKGHVDSGENEIQAGLREAHEECGLKQTNLIQNTIRIGWKGEITGYTENSEMTIFIGEVLDPTDFDKPGFEVSSTKWMTLKEFYSVGRKSQVNIVKSCEGELPRF